MVMVMVMVITMDNSMRLSQQMLVDHPKERAVVVLRLSRVMKWLQIVNAEVS